MKIITSVVNNYIYIELQYHTINKYFQGDFEYIVFNDAKNFEDYTNFNNIEIKKYIEDTCKKLNIKCINIPNEHHRTQIDASTRTSESLNFMLEYQKNNPDKYLIIDSDMFFIDYFNPDKLSKYECAVVLQSRNNNSLHYFWNGLCYMDFNKIKDKELLDWSCYEHCDTGGMMHKWINKWLSTNSTNTESSTHTLPLIEDIRYKKNNRDIIDSDNILFLRHLWSCTWDKNEIPDNLKNNNHIVNYLENDRRNINGKYYCEIYDNCLLHVRAGGNWLKEYEENHLNYTRSLINLVFKLIGNYRIIIF